MKKTNWRAYVRDRIYPQGIAGYLDLIDLKKSNDTDYIAKHFEVISFIGDHFWWARDLDRLEKPFRRWMHAWIRRPNLLRRLLTRFTKVRAQMDALLPRLKARLAEPEKLSDQGLYLIYSQAKTLFWQNVLCSEYTVDLFDDFFYQFFDERLAAAKVSNLLPADRAVLLHPAYVSVVMQYRRDLLKASFAGGDRGKALQNIRNKYYWIMMSWDGHHELTPDRVLSDYRRIMRLPHAKRQSEAQTIAQYRQHVLNERAAVISRLHLPGKMLKPYLHLSDLFAELHDRRKEGQMRNNQVMLSVIRAMAKRFSASYESLLYYTNEEIGHLCLRGKRVRESLIRRRRQGLTYVMEGKKTRTYTGRPAQDILKKLVLDVMKAKRTREFAGMSARPGFAHGRAFVTNDAKIANRRIARGMVLVASMTTVDFIPAMRMASAIVTDDGGLNCHAAIVARELGIPCVVGTKIATQVLQTGDRVEVDATRGIVKKL